MKRIKFLNIFATTLIFMTLGSIAGQAQTTEFSYQGLITDSNAPANGNYDLEFRLFDAATGGTLIGTLQRSNVAVSDGIFGVVLDFGVFPPNNRFLEIGVRPPGGSVLTTLAPRVKLLSTPYSTQARNAENATNATNAVNAQNAQNAVNAQNAANSTNAVNAQNAQTAQNALQLGGTPANQFVLGSDPRLTNPRTPLPGSANYIQNGTNQQGSTNFNISGDGTAGGTLTGNIVNATTHLNIGGFPVLKSPGGFNTFAGLQAGLNITTGEKNSFFGTGASAFITTGNNNSSFGVDAGRFNLSGDDNSIFGTDAGRLIQTGNGNSYFGFSAGESNISGSYNTFMGIRTGVITTGSENTFIGFEAGLANTTGDLNTVIGSDANVGSGGLTNATAIGANAFVTASNSLILGSINGVNGGSDTFVGIGTTDPEARLHVAGIIQVDILDNGGTTAVCRNVNNRLSNCSSSLRYKKNIEQFSSGLNLVDRLRPITFDWKNGGMRDLGLGAEDVEKIEPLLVTYNEKGEVEGVKYDRVAVVLLNAVKEQQAEIEEQRKQISALTGRIEEQKKNDAARRAEIEDLAQDLKRITGPAVKGTTTGSKEQ